MKYLICLGLKPFVFMPSVASRETPNLPAEGVLTGKINIQKIEN